jgi:hypothetical protein
VGARRSAASGCPHRRSRLAKTRGGLLSLVEDYELTAEEIRDAERWWEATSRFEVGGVAA